MFLFCFVFTVLDDLEKKGGKKREVKRKRGKGWVAEGSKTKR